MNEQQIRFVAFRYSHHSPHSGYSRLAEYGATEFDGESIRVANPLSRRLIRERMIRWLAVDTPGYDRASMAAEMQVANRILRESNCLYHFLYGETTYRYIGHLNKFRQNRIVATFHQPYGGFQRAIHRTDHLRQLAAAVCVGRSQEEFLAKILGPERVFFVPLGVDATYFTPPATFAERDPDLCLFVGENYRDFPTFRGVVELVAYRRPQTRFVVVTRPQNFSQIGTHPNITFRTNIPEAEFRNLYRSAALMVMPLHEATANNALLESMACGLPLIVTDVGATRDYVSPECAVLTPPHAARCMADHVLALLGDPVQRRCMSTHAREQALNFAWPTVVKQLRTVYAAAAAN